MKVALFKDGKSDCLLCRFKTTGSRESCEEVMLDHLDYKHGRKLVQREDIFEKKELVKVVYHGTPGGGALWPVS